MKKLMTLLDKKWILPTLLVPLAVGVMIRLGIWQLHRLEQRQTHNQQVRNMIAEEPMMISEQGVNSGSEVIVEENLTTWEYRDAIVTGTYDHRREMVIRNQVWKKQIGVHVLTPLKISGTEQAVLVDRGWLPLEQYQQGRWRDYREPGQQRIQGMIRTSESPPAIGGQGNPTPRAGRHIESWNFVDIEAIQEQMPYSLLPVYIQLAPQGENTSLPYRSQPEFELTPGPHLGYAIQWFAFAAVLGAGYPIYVYRQEEKNG